MPVSWAGGRKTMWKSRKLLTGWRLSQRTSTIVAASTNLWSPAFLWSPGVSSPPTRIQQCFTLQAILGGFLYDFPHDVRKCTDPIVGAAVEIYQRMSTDLLPTPAKSHYVFNLRDLSKCIQGIVLEISRSSEWNFMKLFILGNHTLHLVTRCRPTRIFVFQCQPSRQVDRTFLVLQ